jgi:hypothetical protein
MLRVVFGRRPVRKLMRDGLHTAIWQYARVKTVPDAASDAMAGART